MMPESPVVFSLLLILPAYVANACAALFGGGKPVDAGAHWRGKRIFGPGKTWRGLAAGLFFGTAAGHVEGFLLQHTGLELGSTLFHTQLGLLLAAGALLGDLAASFAKRRAGIPSGKPLLIVDQLDFTVGALLLTAVVYTPSAEQVVFLLAFTPAAHLFLNHAAYKLKCKKVPW